MKHETFLKDVAIGIGVVLLLALLFQVITDPGIHDLIIKTCIFGLFALSLNLLVGYLGLVAFGHATGFATGAYVFGLLMQTGTWTIPAAMGVAVVAAAALAAVIGAFCIRAREIYFAFLTLAFQMILYSAIISFVSLTGGDQGLMGGYPKPPFLGIDLSRPFDYYLFVCGVTVICVILLRQVIQSPFGYALRMIRDNHERSYFLGIQVKLYQWIAFVIASALAAVSGVMMSLFVTGAFPNFAYWSMSAEPLFMILLGGMQTFLGPLLGAFILQLLNDLVTEHTRYYGLVLGLVILFFILGLRRGLLDVVWDKVSDRRRKAGSVRPASPVTGDAEARERP